MVRLAILDDYQNVALSMANWDSLKSAVDIQVFHDTLSAEDAVVERLHDFEIVVAMRERTPFRRSLLERLPKLKLLVTTGMVNASIDVKAAAELGITVCGTRSSSYSTMELAWGLILSLARSIPREDAGMRNGGWQTLASNCTAKYWASSVLAKLGVKCPRLALLSTWKSSRGAKI
jgi:lactate dehydrogenase-like 2-hydroxyacid dehydrogenase